MKKNSLGGILFLLLLAIAVAWFDQEDNLKDVSEPGNLSINGDFLLAVSWQSAFCEQRPNKPECRSQHAGRFDAENFSLHGLWPQPRGNAYCGVSSAIVSKDKSGNWRNLPKLDLSEQLRRDLSVKMPGYRSYLHRHEWFKHGTCIDNITPEKYFRYSLNLLDQLNNSPLRALLADNVGKRLQFVDLQKAMQRSFGNEAGWRFILDCYRDDGRRIIHELKLSLSGPLDEKSLLSTLMSTGKKMPRSCPNGIVDSIGLQ